MIPVPRHQIVAAVLGGYVVCVVGSALAMVLLFLGDPSLSLFREAIQFYMTLPVWIAVAIDCIFTNPHGFTTMQIVLVALSACVVFIAVPLAVVLAIARRSKSAVILFYAFIVAGGVLVLLVGRFVSSGLSGCMD